jgi:hypothetical protein
MAFRKLTSEFLRLRSESARGRGGGDTRRSSSFGSTSGKGLLASQDASSSAWEQVRNSVLVFL